MSQRTYPREQIGDYAEKIGEFNGIYAASGKADVRSFVEALGGRIEISSDSESLHISPDGTFTIFIPLSTSTKRDTFTIAHELGHYFLHYLLPKHLDEPFANSFNRGGSSVMERDANVFAASLLMPREKFTEQWERSDGDEFVVAARFDVSPAAARVRASVLGLSRG